MKAEYDLAKMKSRKNPFAAQLKQQSISIEIENDIIEYFKNMGAKTDISYQHLINLYLRDCMEQHRKVDIQGF